MTKDLISDYFNLPGAEDIKRWEVEYGRIGQMIHELEKKRAYLAGVIAAARGERPTTIAALSRKADGTHRAGTWAKAVADIARAHPEGISYDEVRKLLPSPLAETIARKPTSKAFYKAMTALERDEVIVRHRGYIFSPAGYKRHSDKVGRGEIPEVSGNNYRESPMGDEIKKYLRAHGPATGGALRQHLATMPQFAESMRNSSAVFNVLKRLVDRDEVHRDKESATYSVANENGAPHSKDGSAPDTGEAPTSPADAQPSLRLVR